MARMACNSSGASIRPIGRLPKTGKMLDSRRRFTSAAWCGTQVCSCLLYHSRATTSKEFSAESFLRKFAAFRSADGSRSASNCLRISSRFFRASPRMTMGRLGIVPHQCRQQRTTGISIESFFTGQHLVKHRAERADVTANVYWLAHCLFRRHVGQRADDHSGTRRCVGSADRSAYVTTCRLRGCELGQAEVEHLNHSAIVDHDIRRLEIAMNHARGVGPRERIGDLNRISGSDVSGQSAGLQPVREIPTFRC